MHDLNNFSTFMAKIPQEYVPRVEQAISDACRVLGDPSWTSDQADRVHRQLGDLQSKVGIDSLNALKREIEQRLHNQWAEAGHSGQLVEKYLAPRVNDLLARTENARLMTQPAYWSALKAMSGTKLMVFGGIVMGVFVVSGGLKEGHDVLSNINWLFQSAEIANINLNASEFRTFTSRVRTATSIAAPTPQVAALPAPVAVAAQVPIAVTIRERDKPEETYVVPLGHLYEAAPPAIQREINSSTSSPPQSDVLGHRCPIRPFAVKALGVTATGRCS